MKDSVLYNCRDDLKEPDWSQFRHVEIGGCKRDPHDPRHILGGATAEEAEFWTVYGRHHGGDVEALADCETRDLADAVAARMAEISGLAVEDRTCPDERKPFGA